jgi:hypothetical protein
LTNWPLLFREICEAYHLTPAALDDLTIDQIFIMSAKKADLRMGGMQQVNIFEARQLGVVQRPGLGQPQSLVQRIRAKNKAKTDADAKNAKRQRRREFDANLKAARARGEKV